ncbi:hypothetical protein MIC448_460009 [Microbacterium sp. C448]|nr:hypothetical protein MIC448_460009 [Microbacterium sp. C448]
MTVLRIAVPPAALPSRVKSRVRHVREIAVDPRRLLLSDGATRGFSQGIHVFHHVFEPRKVLTVEFVPPKTLHRRVGEPCESLALDRLVVLGGVGVAHVSLAVHVSRVLLGLLCALPFFEVAASETILSRLSLLPKDPDSMGAVLDDRSNEEGRREKDLATGVEACEAPHVATRGEKEGLSDFSEQPMAGLAAGLGNQWIWRRECGRVSRGGRARGGNPVMSVRRLVESSATQQE